MNPILEFSLGASVMEGGSLQGAQLAGFLEGVHLT